MQTTDYENQAQDFLDKFGIRFRATLSDSKLPPWSGDPETHVGGGKVSPMDVEKPRHHYRITMSKHVRIPSVRVPYLPMLPKRITFDYWGSIRDAEEDRHPTPYDVLACISSDMHCAESFQDFCSEFGESEDSIKALQTFRRCSAFSKRLKAFFSQEEIEALEEIR